MMMLRIVTVLGTLCTIAAVLMTAEAHNPHNAHNVFVNGRGHLHERHIAARHAYSSNTNHIASIDYGDLPSFDEYHLTSGPGISKRQEAQTMTVANSLAAAPVQAFGGGGGGGTGGSSSAAPGATAATPQPAQGAAVPAAGANTQGATPTSTNSPSQTLAQDAAATPVISLIHPVQNNVVIVPGRNFTVFPLGLVVVVLILFALITEIAVGTVLRFKYRKAFRIQRQLVYGK